MINKDFLDSVNAIIAKGFAPEGLQKLDEYAEFYITRRFEYQQIKETD